MRDKRILLDPKGLAQLVANENITAIHTGPSVWWVILDHVPDFPKIRVVISSGEAISPELARRLANKGETVWNLYGPTEATVRATGHVLTPDQRADEAAISAPIGTALSGVEVIIEDDAGNPVTDGHKGNCCLAVFVLRGAIAASQN